MRRDDHLGVAGPQRIHERRGRFAVGDQAIHCVQIAHFDQRAAFEFRTVGEDGEMVGALDHGARDLGFGDIEIHGAGPGIECRDGEHAMACMEVPDLRERQGAYTFARLGAIGAAYEKDIAAGRPARRGSDPLGIGEDRQPRDARQLIGKSERRRAGVDEQAVAAGKQFRRPPGDPALLDDLVRHPDGKGSLLVRRQSGRPAMEPAQETGAVEGQEVAPDRLMRDREQMRQFIYGNAPALGHGIDDLYVPVCGFGHDLTHLLTKRNRIPTIPSTVMEQVMPGSFPRRDIDIVIVGGGVIGCAMARRFTLEGASVLLIERAPDILAGASKGNSAILHTGYDAEPGSLELKCVRDGYEEYLAIRQRLGLPVLETGAMVVAWSPDELARLADTIKIAHANGIGDAQPLAPDLIYAREPGLAPGALGAVLLPGEHIIDPWSAPLAYLQQAVSNGAQLRRGTELRGAKFLEGIWHLETNSGPIAARWLINCAGLWGDRVEQLALGQSSFTIKPRKGQFVVLDKAASAHMRTTLLPVPTERTKGIVLCRTIFGNVLVGPTAEETDERDIATVDHNTLAHLLAHAARLVPALSQMPVTAVYAGLRPATELKQYRIDCRPKDHYIAAGGIRSTGLTGALGIARHVFDLYSSAGNPHDPIGEPLWPDVPALAEHCKRDFTKPGHGEIVCHCENVTRREIEQALEGDLGARDIGGLKRRTRAMMGRCQGFYCSAAVAAICDEHLAIPLATGSADDGR